MNMNGNKSLSIHIGGVYVLKPDETVKEAKKSISKELNKFGGNLQMMVSDFNQTIDELSNARVYFP